MLVAFVKETKLDVNSSLKEFTDSATIRRDRPTRSSIGLVILVPNMVPDGDILPNDDPAEDLAVEADVCGTVLTFFNVHVPPVSACPWNYSPDFEVQIVLSDFNAHHPS